MLNAPATFADKADMGAQEPTRAWVRGALWVAVLAVLPFLLPTPVLYLALAVYVLPAVACTWSAYRRVPRARIFLACAGLGHALHLIIGVDHILGDGRTSPLSSAVVICQAALYFAAALSLSHARRPHAATVGFADGFAASIGIVVMQWQWLALADGATGRAIAAQTVFFVSVFVLVAILTIFGGVGLDPRQNRWLLAMVGSAAVLLVVGVTVNGNLTRPDRAAEGAACYFVAGYLLTRFYRSPDFARMFEVEPPRRRLFSLRWAGPACALVATPLMITMLVAAHRVPTLSVGLAGAALTGVALWRGTRLFRDRERVQRELLDEQRFRALVEHGADVIVLVDSERRITYVSGGAGTPFDSEAAALIGKEMTDICDAGDVVHLERVFDSLPEEGAGMSLDRDICVHTADGERRWVTVHVTNRHASATIGGWVLNIHDVTERKRAEQALAMLAHYDSLTGLPNRIACRAELEGALATDTGDTVLLFCDLDGFKAVNDTLGHDSGDEVLRIVAGRWSRCLRSGDVLGRWGGDEFLVICPGVGSKAEAEAIAARLVACLEEPLTLALGQAQVGVSVGMATQVPGEAADRLIGRADAAMYTAKQRGMGVHVG